MRKTELVNAVADATDMGVRQADDVVSAILEHITNAMSRGEVVSLAGFGTFSVKSRSPRTGRHPRTGEVITISAVNVPTFKAGKNLKDAVR